MSGRIGGGKRFGVAGLRRRGRTTCSPPTIKGIRKLILDLLIRSSNVLISSVINIDLRVPSDPESTHQADTFNSCPFSAICVNMVENVSVPHLSSVLESR